MILLLLAGVAGCAASPEVRPSGGPAPEAGGASAGASAAQAQGVAGDGGEEADVELERLGAITRARLPNGMTILVVESHSAPVVAAQVWVQVGSADEGPEEAGLAHLHEHMLFKGTDKRGVGEIAQAIEAAGGEINAWTSFDHTVYHVVLASRYLELGLEVLSDAVLRSAFDAGELDREKKVVLEEIKRTRDMPGRWLGDLLFEAAFKTHPYGHNILGSARSVAGVDRPAILAFFRKHYRPERMTLVVAGDVQPEGVVARARRLFPGSRDRTAALPERPAEPAQRRLRARVLEDEIQETHVGLAWHIPDVRHPDAAALDVLATVLGQGESSRFNQELKRGRGLVSDAYAYAYSPQDAGLLVAGLTCRPAQALEAVERMALEVARLAASPVGAAELAKVKAMVESDALYQGETVQGLARRVGYHQSLTGDPTFGDTYLGRVLAVTPADLQRVARAYLTSSNLSAVALAPRPSAALAPAGEGEPPPRLTRLALAAAVERGLAAAPAAEVEESAAEGGVTRVKLRQGPVLIVQEDHSIPLVALRAVFLGGSRYETAADAGVHSFLAGLLTKGCGALSAGDVAREVDALAGGMDGFSGRNTFGLRAEFPARHLDRGLALFADCLRKPTLPEKEIKRERELTLDEITARDDNLSGLAFDLFAASLYPQHPYRLPILGTRKSVAAFRRAQLRELLERWFTPERMVLAVVGDVDTARVVEQAKALFGARAAGAKPAAAPSLPLDPPAGGVRVVTRHRARAQAHLVLGFMGARLTGGDRHALEVLMAVLTGQGGRLFVELRDKRSLAYSLSGFSLEGIEPGYVAFYLGVDPKRAGEARDALLAELQGVLAGPLPAEEIERAKRYLIGTQAISLQRTSARAAAMAFSELYGLGHLAHTRYAEEIHAVTAGDVHRVAREYLKLGTYTLAVVGPQDQLPELEPAAPAPAPEAKP
ncbi:MAG TPA: pitrilysin family protein [Myxococcota bacterium]|nr:pitrilysin family protein [Myxococcota bacterium]HRY96675.1 pitrilysin family protein [Myxococcota bacterium]HSA20587.1 pitrilysin family protein [Myxococcota bacterium]